MASNLGLYTPDLAEALGLHPNDLAARLDSRGLSGFTIAELKKILRFLQRLAPRQRHQFGVSGPKKELVRICSRFSLSVPSFVCPLSTRPSPGVAVHVYVLGRRFGRPQIRRVESFDANVTAQLVISPQQAFHPAPQPHCERAAGASVTAAHAEGRASMPPTQILPPAPALAYAPAAHAVPAAAPACAASSSPCPSSSLLSASPGPAAKRVKQFVVKQEATKCDELPQSASEAEALSQLAAMQFDRARALRALRQVASRQAGMVQAGQQPLEVGPWHVDAAMVLLVGEMEAREEARREDAARYASEEAVDRDREAARQKKALLLSNGGCGAIFATFYTSASALLAPGASTEGWSFGRLVRGLDESASEPVPCDEGEGGTVHAERSSLRRAAMRLLNLETKAIRWYGPPASGFFAELASRFEASCFEASRSGDARGHKEPTRGPPGPPATTQGRGFGGLSLGWLEAARAWVEDEAAQVERALYAMPQAEGAGSAMGEGWSRLPAFLRPFTPKATLEDDGFTACQAIADKEPAPGNKPMLTRPVVIPTRCENAQGSEQAVVICVD
mmetsp:Transcript_27786/g.62026  ORF Transcript_27786/g.62026 Transcript_27786/m.62026 type:complete len:563 (+) Transcript_27786:84-1772(+)